MKGKFAVLEHRCRVLFLANFDMGDYDEIIKYVWGDGIAPEDWEYTQSAKRIGWNASNWKQVMIDKMVVSPDSYISNP